MKSAEVDLSGKDAGRMVELTLLRRDDPLADPAAQLRVLAETHSIAPFEQTLYQQGLSPLRADGLSVLQINVGKLCNQTCRHCHVDAGPDRREIMSPETADLIISVLKRTNIPTLDITGGAPEMNPSFRDLVEQARQLGRHVIDRCNLTILVAPGFEDLPEFLTRNQVEVVASLPCYLEENVDRQRGNMVFQRSIEALQRLNALGYGRPDSSLKLTLAFNPLGAGLPPAQEKLEAAYRRELHARYGIEFSRLITITNMPISRFLDDLLQSGKYESYMQTLVNAFNPATVSGVMCRSTLSVDWQGYLYDCDFNQMLGLPLIRPLPAHLRDFDEQLLRSRAIATGPHCYGCTAGAGSGCQGAIQS
jgi:radical SAM/Cys-rich protein